MHSSFAPRFVLTAFAALALVVLVQGSPPVVNAGEPTASFDPDPLQILEGGAANLVVAIQKDLTADEAADKEINVDLTLPGLLGDTVIDSKAVPVPGADPQEDDTVNVAATFVMRCTDDIVEGDVGSTGAASAVLEVEFPDTTPDTAASGSGTVECVGVAIVVFDPNPLEIEEGAEEKVAVKFTKHLSAAEATNNEITVRLMHQGTDTLLGEKKVKVPGQAKIGKKFTWTTSFQLQCKHNEIRGLNGTGLASAPLSVEFTEGGEDAGDGLARCIGRTSQTVPSGGSHPSDVFVDEETALTYALNAFDGAIGVFDGTTQIGTINLPCVEVTGASSVEPSGFDCRYQDSDCDCDEHDDHDDRVGAEGVTPGGSRVIVAVDAENDALLVVVLPNDALVAGPPQITEIPVGDAPTGLALDPVTHLYYVANSGDGTVSVVDVHAALVVDTIAVGGVPRNAAADPTAGIVYVTDFTGDAVHVIDTSTNIVTDTISVGDGAEGIVVDPQTRDVYVTNFVGDSLTVISGAAGPAVAGAVPITVQTVPIGDGAIDVDVNPLTNRIFVVNVHDRTVAIVDRTTLEVTATLPTGITPDAVTVNQSNGLVYVANHDVNSLTIFSDTSPYDDRLWADMDCDDAVGAGDVLVILSTIGSVPTAGISGCPGVGQPVNVFGYPEQIWADVNCEGTIDAFDALATIRFGAGLPDGDGLACPSPGTLALIN